MKRRPPKAALRLTCLGLFFGFAVPATAQGFCVAVDGADIVARDGTYLGRVTNKFDARSIMNRLGDYGSSLADRSIWNELGDYGGEIADQSPFNPIAAKPPVVLKNGQQIGILSVRKTPDAINPYAVAACE